MKAICKRELRALFGGMRGWGYAAIVLLGTAVSVLTNNLLSGAPKFELNAYYVALSMIPATALATADAFQAERRQNTERLLFSLPLSNADIVLGKMLALIVPVAGSMAVICLFPLLLSLFGTISLASAYGSIAALFAMGVAMMAIGLGISVCANRASVAALITVVVLVLSWAAPYAGSMLEATSTLTVPMMLAFMLLAFVATYFLSNSSMLGIVMAAAVEIPLLLAYLQGNGAAVLDALGGGVYALSLFDGLNSFVNGLFDGRTLIAWMAAAAFIVFLTVLYVGNRRQGKRRAL